MSAPALDEQHLHGSERGRDVEDVEVADVSDAEHPRPELSVASGDRDPEALPEGEDELAGVDAVRGEDRRDDRRPLLVGREQRQAHRLRPFPAGTSERCVTCERCLESLVEQQLERLVERDDERHGRRERRRPGLERGAQLRPVEVHPRSGRARAALPGRRRDRGEREPGRCHQRLLRAGDDDVESPRIGLERNRAEARDRVDHRERAGLARCVSERLHVGDHARRGLGVDEEDHFRSCLLDPAADDRPEHGVSPHA